jgi:hypothetical protein
MLSPFLQGVIVGGAVAISAYVMASVVWLVIAKKLSPD